jgi:hypothetical protein
MLCKRICVCVCVCCVPVCVHVHIFVYCRCRYSLGHASCSLSCKLLFPAPPLELRRREKRGTLFLELPVGQGKRRRGRKGDADVETKEKASGGLDRLEMNQTLNASRGPAPNQSARACNDLLPLDLDLSSENVQCDVMERYSVVSCTYDRKFCSSRSDHMSFHPIQ